MIMGKDNEHKPDVYRRLELVQKQFERNAADRKKQEAAEKRQKLFDDISNYFRRNKIRLLRITVFTILAMLVLAVIMVVIFD
jgi:hypothetical protein